MIKKQITSSKLHPNRIFIGKNHFHKNPSYFRVYADFAADNGKDNISIGFKITSFCKPNPVCNCYHIVTELEDVSNSEYKSRLVNENVDWFVDEIFKLENKLNFYFKDTKKDIIMTQDDKKDSESNNICRFCEENIEPDKNRLNRDHCHLTGKYRGPAHNICNTNVKQKESNFLSVIIHNFSKYDCHLFFKTLVDKKKVKVAFKVIAETNEGCISIRYVVLDLSVVIYSHQLVEKN